MIHEILKRLDPETAHNIALKALKYLHPLLPPSPQDNPLRVMGINFRNRVGLAAGWDKNGESIKGLTKLGFGFIEVGTVTPFPQPGNPRPRLFRIPEAQALINRMGFNNQGVSQLVKNLEKSKPYTVPIGVSIGRNRTTIPMGAISDYRMCLHRTYEVASYIAINVSSPNTTGLRVLEEPRNLEGFLDTLIQEKWRLQDQTGKDTPLVLKISPDLTVEDLKRVAAIAASYMDGIIATNTTVSRARVETKESGGLSGAPLKVQSLAVVRQLHSELQGALPIIGCGGIMSGSDAEEFIEAGATLVQILTGFVYHGPSLIVQCSKDNPSRCRATPGWGAVQCP